MSSQKQIEANRRNALKSTSPKTPETKAIVSKNAVRHGLRARHAVIDGESWIEFDEFRNELIRHLAPVGFLEQLLADRIIAAFWRLHRVAQIEVELFNYLQQPKPTRATGSCSNDIQKPTPTPPAYVKIVKTYPAESSSKYLGGYSADEAKTRLNELKDTFEQISRMNISSEHAPALRQYLTDLSSLDFFIDSLPQENRTQLSETIDELTTMENSLKTRAIDDFRMKFTIGRTMHDDLKSRNALTTFQRYESNIERSLFKSLHELQRFQSARHGGPVSIPPALDLNIS
jgi:hypothetical protein